MSAMTKDRSRKSGKGEQGGRPKPIRTGVPLSIYIPAPLRSALDALAESTRRPVTTEVIIALEKHLKEAGLWPPQSPPAAGGQGG